jgi:hypothetical protein
MRRALRAQGLLLNTMRPLRVRLFHSFHELPACYSRLFEEVGRTNFYLSLPWFRNLTDTVRDPGDALRIYGVDQGDGPADARTVLVMRQRSEIGGRKNLRVLSGYSNFYSMVFAPVMRRDEPDAASVLRSWVKAVIAERPAWDAVSLSSLEHDAPFRAPLIRALRSAGVLLSQQPEFVNWYLPVAGMNFDDYFKSLPGQLRSQITTKTRRITRQSALRFESCAGTQGLETVIAAYQHIYERSWKEPEPYPDFIPGLIRASAAAGALRMFVLYVDDVPAASQIWFVAGGKATIYKLAYDEAYKKLSVGSILTAHIMQELMAQDELVEVDFGHGDDPYKKEWLRCRRERQAIEGYNPRTAKGLFLGGAIIAGRAAKAQIRRFSNRSETASAAEPGQGGDSPNS